MNPARAEAIAARAQLERSGWIPRGAESFRHLPPPDARDWLDAPIPHADSAFASAWRIEGERANVDAQWLDATDPAQRGALLEGLPAPDDGDDAAPFAWAHRALVRDGLRLRIAPSAQPTVLQLDRAAVERVEAPLLAIELLPGAQCVLLETHTAATTQNLQVHVRVGEGAQLDHVRLVQSATGAQLAHHIAVHVAAGARYAQRLLATGAAYHLQRTLVDLDATGAAATVRGVLLAAGTVLEQQVRSCHAAPASRSDVEMLALGSGNARIVGNAFTSIAPGCDGAAVRQRLAGIPTSGQPKLVLRPHLEIHHDDVEAAHGATWGALPEDALFHARQRGLDETAATAMIVEGLARAVLAREGELPAQADAALAAAVREHLATAKEGKHG